MTTTNGTRAAIYARVSTTDQTCENQLLELRRYVEACGWTATEYVDHGVSGSKDRRPALDDLMADAKRRKVDVVICWKLDRFGRSLTHLVNAIQSLTDTGVRISEPRRGHQYADRHRAADAGHPCELRRVRARPTEGTCAPRIGPRPAQWSEARTEARANRDRRPAPRRRTVSARGGKGARRARIAGSQRAATGVWKSPRAGRIRILRKTPRRDDVVGV